MYDDGDVCVQPSHWEGLGLQLIECQAAGLPLVTTDAPPMNELHPLRTVPVAATEIVSVQGNHVFTSHRLSPEDLASTLEPLYGCDISQASQEARDSSSSKSTRGTTPDGSFKTFWFDERGRWAGRAQ